MRVNIIADNRNSTVTTLLMARYPADKENPPRVCFVTDNGEVCIRAVTSVCRRKGGRVDFKGRLVDVVQGLDIVGKGVYYGDRRTGYLILE